MGKKIRIIFGVLLFSVGIICFLYPNVREWKMQREVDHIMESFEKNHFVQDDKSKENADEVTETDGVLPGDVAEQESVNAIYPELYAEMQEYNENLIVSGQVITDAWSYQQSPIDVSSLENGTVGYIEIPDMKVRLPLYLGASSDNLAKGAAVLSGTSMPIGGESTNCVIAGHRGWRGSAYFQYIENMQAGSLVYITNPWGTLTYQVTGVDVVKPSAVDCIKIQEGKDMVTLISCHPYVIGGGPYRYIVYCERTEDSNATATESLDSEKDILEKEQSDANTGISLTLSDEGNLLEWETRLRTMLPALTLILAGVIVFIRNIRDNRNKKHKN